MALRGFEPPTPRLRVWCSNQAELQDHLSVNIEKKFHLKKFVIYLCLNNLSNELERTPSNCFSLITASEKVFFALSPG